MSSCMECGVRYADKGRLCSSCFSVGTYNRWYGEFIEDDSEDDDTVEITCNHRGCNKVVETMPYDKWSSKTGDGEYYIERYCSECEPQYTKCCSCTNMVYNPSKSPNVQCYDCDSEDERIAERERLERYN